MNVLPFFRYGFLAMKRVMAAVCLSSQYLYKVVPSCELLVIRAEIEC